MNEIPDQEPEQQDQKSKSLDSAEAYFKRGLEYLDLDNIDRDMEKAIIEFDQALQLNPDFVDVYKQRGLTYVWMSWTPGEGHTSEYYRDLAIRDFTQSIQLNPDDVKVYIMRAGLYRREDFDRAIRDYDQAIRLEPNNAKVYRDRGFAYEINGDLEHAISDFTKAIEINPDEQMYYNNRGLAYGKKGDLD